MKHLRSYYRVYIHAQPGSRSIHVRSFYCLFLPTHPQRDNWSQGLGWSDIISIFRCLDLWSFALLLIGFWFSVQFLQHENKVWSTTGSIKCVFLSNIWLWNYLVNQNYSLMELWLDSSRKLGLKLGLKLLETNLKLDIRHKHKFLSRKTRCIATLRSVWNPYIIDINSWGLLITIYL